MKATADQLRRAANFLEELSEVRRRLNVTVVPANGDDLVLKVNGKGPAFPIVWDAGAEAYHVDDGLRAVNELVAARFKAEAL